MLPALFSPSVSRMATRLRALRLAQQVEAVGEADADGGAVAEVDLVDAVDQQPVSAS